MKFEISQALLIERTIVVCATILLFGLVSIGGLWLWRRLTSGNMRTEPQQNTAPSIEKLDELVRAVERLGTAVGQQQQHSSQPSRETLTQGAHR